MGVMLTLHGSGVGASDPLGPFFAVAHRVDARAPWSLGHAQRVASYARAIALEAGWAEVDAVRLARAAELHDVGKVCVAEELLSHPGPLDEAARAEVELHAGLGAGMLATVLTPEEVGWVRHHHERWDGGGYPEGLHGDSIPDGAVIVGLAETWDVLRSAGPVRDRPLLETDALAECRSVAGSQFPIWAVDALERAVQALRVDLIVKKSRY